MTFFESLEIDLDRYWQLMERFRALDPEAAEAMDSPCECDGCEAAREAARGRWRAWLRDRGRGGALVKQHAIDRQPLGTLKFLGDEYRIYRGRCARCGEPVFVLIGHHDRPTTGLWIASEIHLVAGVGAGNPHTTAHHCPAPWPQPQPWRGKGGG